MQTIFVEKMALYGNFIEFLNDIHNDNVIEQHEINKMIEWGGETLIGLQPWSDRRYIPLPVPDYCIWHRQLTAEHKRQWKVWIKEHFETDNEKVIREALRDDEFMST